MTELEALPFDQFPRYRLVADLLGELRGDGPLTVLDVGGGTGLLREFLPDVRVTAVDLAPEAGGAEVLGDGAALPFLGRAFDAVVAVDTLEHVPPARRHRFVAECARVARHWVLLVGPYAAPRVDAAEELCLRFLEQVVGVQHRYLKEHRRFGLPDRYATARQLEGLGAQTVAVGHGQLERWLQAMCFELYADHQPLLRRLLGDFRRFYNRACYESDGAPPHYRHALVAALAGSALPQREEKPPVAVPAEVTAVSGAFLRQLQGFDREREIWRPELERLAGVIGDLERDLASHKEVLRETGADLEGHRATLATLRESGERAREEAHALEETLRADLAEHARVLAELTESHRRVLGEARQQRHDMEREIQSLREHSANLERERDAIRGQRESLTRRYDDLQAELELTCDQSQRLSADLTRARDELQWSLASLQQREARIETLEERLASRWHALKRIVRPERAHRRS